MAGDILMSVSKDEHERARFRSRRMYQTDLASNLATAEDRGEQRGIQIGEKRGEKIGEKRGEKKKAFAVALNALKMGIPADDIARLTGLTFEEINRLRHGG